MDTHTARTIVEDFLRSFYAPEPHDHLAAAHALEALVAAGNGRWHLHLAFRRVLDEAGPVYALRELVAVHAGRPVDSDREARGFLWKVYRMNLLDVAIPPEEGDGS